MSCATLRVVARSRADFVRAPAHPADRASAAPTERRRAHGPAPTDRETTAVPGRTTAACLARGSNAARQPHDTFVIPPRPTQRQGFLPKTKRDFLAAETSS